MSVDHIVQAPSERDAGAEHDLQLSGAHEVVATLLKHEVAFVYFVPGESFLGVLDALIDAPSIFPVVCRHEAGAGNMADAYGKLTGRPGVCIVSRGPGAAHASIACHTAMQDGTPLILIVGDVSSTERGLDTFQEVASYEAMFGPLSKRVIRIDAAHRVSELLDTAFNIALAGRPGPVVVTIPEDVFTARLNVRPASSAGVLRTENGVGEEALEELERYLSSAVRPVIVAGGGNWRQQDSADLQAFATTHGLPVVSTFRSQDVIDNNSDVYVGTLGFGTDDALWEYLDDADLIINVGARFDSPSTRGYEAFSGGGPRRLVHFHPDPAQLAARPTPDLGVVSSVRAAVDILARLDARPSAARRDALADLRARYVRWGTPGPSSTRVNLGEIVASLPAELGPDSIITTGAGNYTLWVHRYFRFQRVGSYLGPRNGAMGYGIPAAIAAKLLRPTANVVAFAGDGCFMMSSHELCTIKKYDLKIILVVINNSMYGTIRMHQDRQFPGRPFATSLTNPDFLQLAASYGFGAHRVRDTYEFMPALRSALGSDSASLIEVCVDDDVAGT